MPRLMNNMTFSSSLTDVTDSDSLRIAEIDIILTDNVIVIYQWIILAVICQFIDLFGVGTNIVNIICFVKQGFQDPVNVSLVGLAVSDMGCLATLVWTNICFTPSLTTADLPFDATEIQYLTSSMPHTTFARITAWITALITLERCLCITVPLKVKNIITTKRVSVTIGFVYLILISASAPVYVVNTLGMKFFAHRNKTLLGLVHLDNHAGVERVSYVINNTFLPLTACVIIIVGTITLVVTLQTKTKWRKKSAVAGQIDNVSSRNTRVAKMVVSISLIFIACFVPFGIIFVVMSIESEFSITGRYKKALTIVGGFCLVLESINSAGNIFIYYHMSSKYRDTFRQLFRMD